MANDQRCPICSVAVTPSARYPNYVCGDCWKRAVDENGRPVEFGYSQEASYTVLYSDTKMPYPTGICYIDGVRCLAREDYWGGSVVAYPYNGEE